MSNKKQNQKQNQKINPVHNNKDTKQLDKKGQSSISKETELLLQETKTDRQKILDMQAQIDTLKAKSIDRAVKLQKDDGVKVMIDGLKKQLTSEQENAGKLIKQYQESIDKIAGYEQEIAYYSGLVNVNPKVKVKVKKVKENGNRKFDLTVSEDKEGPNGLDIKVKYNITNDLNEYYLNSQDNKIGHDDYKALRKAVTKKLSTYPELTEDTGKGKNYPIRDMLNKLKLEIQKFRIIES